VGRSPAARPSLDKETVARQAACTEQVVATLEATPWL
jgi:hypothetical protein